MILTVMSVVGVL